MQVLLYCTGKLHLVNFMENCDNDNALFTY